MKIRKRCFWKFDEEDVLDISPATELADIFLQDIGFEDIDDLFPQGGEKLGARNLLGFQKLVAVHNLHNCRSPIR